MKLFLILLAVLVGVASTVQSATNGALSTRTGLPTTILINATVVFAGAVLFWLVLPSRPDLPDAPRPWFLFLGGAYGLTIIAGAAFCFPRLGAGPTVAVMIASMLLAAVAFDHVGVGQERIPVTPSRVLGCGLLLAGALLVLWPKLGTGSGD